MKIMTAILISLLVSAGCGEPKMTQKDVEKAEFEYGVMMGAVLMSEFERDTSHHFWKLPGGHKGRYLIRKAYMERGTPNEKIITLRYSD